MKRILAIGIGLMCVPSVWALPLTPEEALSRLEKRMTRSAETKDESLDLQLTLPALNGEAALYVFNYTAGKGYLVLSADDCTIPLIGYSDHGTIDPDHMPAPLANWLQEYTRQISYLKSSNKALESYLSRETLPGKAAIDPMIKTQWNQDAPYNSLCPVSNGINCYTGCVATSMAQIMKYYEYPSSGKGSVSYAWGNKTLSMDFSEKPFDWDNMLDIYQVGQYTEIEGDAVAYLMKATGYAMKMAYSTNVSGAYSPTIAENMIEYFGYDEGMFYADRSNYSYDEWTQMLYENLEAGMPIIYDGNNASSEGHSFICDGYDGNGMFHFNWGWGGSSDGYYTLDLLNPSSIGIGGAGGGFNFLQDALLGIKPSDGKTTDPVITFQQYGALFCNRVNNGSMYLGASGGYPYSGWGYIGVGDVAIKMGVIIENTQTGDVQYLECANSSNFDTPMPSGAVFPYDSNDSKTSPRVNLKNANLESGVPYKFTLAASVIGEEENWIPFTAFYGFPNYVLVTFKGTQGYEVTNIGVENYKASNLELLSDLYYGCPVKVKASISNETDLQLSNGVSLVLLDNKGVQRFMSDGFLLTLDPGESIEHEWVAQLNLVSGSAVTKEAEEFTMVLFNLETGMQYEMEETYTVTMEPNPGTPVFTSSIEATNARWENNSYIVTDPSAIDLSLNLNLSSGYFGYPVTFNILYEPQKGTGNLYNLLQQNYNEIPFLDKENPEVTLNTTMNFPNPNIGETYYFFARYYINGQYKGMDTKTTLKAFRVEESGVETVLEEDLKTYFDRNNETLFIFGASGLSNVEIYSIDGRSLKKITVQDKDSQIDLKDLNSGILIIRISDEKGTVKTMKVVK